MTLEKMLAADVVQAVLDKAKSGDMAAARLVIDRIVPVRKGRPRDVENGDHGDITDLVWT